MPYRIFYATGPGDVIQAHRHWRRNEPDPTQVSITLSSQFEDLCQEIGAKAYIVSQHPRKEILRDRPFTLEHRPKPMPGAKGGWYHLREVLYGLGLLATALRFKADVEVIDSGTTHYFVTTLYRLLGIQVVVVLHNALWPDGFPPTRPVPRLIQWLNSLFFRWVPVAIIGVSPICTRQVEQLTGGRHKALRQIRYQFRRELFQQIPPPPAHEQRPFPIVFLGRIVENKDVFDLLEIAQRIEALIPGRCRWEICGAGPALEELKRRHQELGLGQIVNIRGWTAPAEYPEVYARSHALIVLTRSSFAEGMAQTSIEGILAGRPVIINPVVHAWRC
jgi:glycosyltransferase involved in cell wall biosynthesis